IDQVTVPSCWPAQRLRPAVAAVNHSAGPLRNASAPFRLISMSIAALLGASARALIAPFSADDIGPLAAAGGISAATWRRILSKLAQGRVHAGQMASRAARSSMALCASRGNHRPA